VNTRAKGFKCTDSFAEYMGADYDSNGDGKVDSDGLALCAWRKRIQLRDAHHQHAALDDSRRQHPLGVGQQQLRLHPVGRHAPDLHRRHRHGRLVRRLHRSGAPRYTSITGGKNPIWNRYGHERMGWAVSTSNPNGTTIRPAISLLMSRAAHNPAWLKSSPD
jgi:hypothetical protein